MKPEDSRELEKYVTSTYDIRVRNIPHPSPPQDYKEKIKIDDEKLAMILKDVDIPVEPINHDKIKLESMLLYYSINNELVKIERSLREAKNIRSVLLQKYAKAKESLVLHDRILATQSSEARDYFTLICAIYEAAIKYTLPSSKLLDDLIKIQSELEIEAKPKESSLTNIADTIADALRSTLNIPKTEVVKTLKEVALFVQENVTKYQELEKKSKQIYDLSFQQRDVAQKDIMVILQLISDVNKKIAEIETDFNKVHDNIDKLLRYMQDKLEIQVNNGIPSL